MFIPVCLYFVSCAFIHISMLKIKLIIADDHPVIIEGMKMALAQEAGIVPVADVNNGRQLLQLLESKPADVVLMDINMPEMDGIVTTQEINRLYPDIKVIAFSQYNDKHFIRRMLKAGARGYLLKSTPSAEIIEAIKAVFEGRIYLGKNLPELYSNKKKLPQKQFIPDLSTREKEVLKQICLEKNTREIAETLFISPHTVETHRANLLLKTGARNTAGLVKWAIENDILE